MESRSTYLHAQSKRLQAGGSCMFSHPCFWSRSMSTGFNAMRAAMQDLMQFPDRLRWYEAKFCAEDMPDWNPGRFLHSKQVAPGLKHVAIECEINRERIPLRNAYKTVGQRASVRVNNGVEAHLTVSSAPFPQALNKDPLFRVRGDLFAHEIKTVKEVPSIKGELHLLVSMKDSPDVYALEEGDSVEVGPFQGTGLDLRSSALMAIYRYPTIVMFVEGKGIAHARALVHATPDVVGLSLKFRKDVRIYYKVPNEMSVCYGDEFDTWDRLGCKVTTTTSSFSQAFEDDDTLVYNPEYTGAIILTDGDAEAERGALEACKEAEISEIIRDSAQQPEVQYLNSVPTSFLKFRKE